ncbi:trace amine-associated receptor 13c-like [Pygocentrus nattereri]|uniref:trace amine-associated receptor 13c-like n=1 Tax=Pygocentrus nattereri TaxID=42514 RepID=UPI0008144037|nr:trace amine-associated receptor 13c-like [Pygocentrus nattereri]
MNATEVNRTDHCLQFSCPERSVSTAVYVLLYVCAAAVVLLTVCGNLLIIISVCHFKQLHTPTNMLVLSLAVSDFLVGLFVMPFHFMWLIESCWMFGHVFCVLFNFVSFQLTSVSVGNIALIALDRYVALSHPFLYSKDVTSTVIHAVILLTWLFSLLYNFAMFYVGGNFTDLVLCPGECLYYLGETNSLVDLLFVVIVPCTLMVVLYVQVFVIARRHANAIRELNHNVKSISKMSSDSMRSERKAAKVLGVLVIVFLVCLVPYYVCSLMSDAVSADSSYLVVNNILILFYLNSSINPVIYALFYSWFQRCMKMILTCKILHTDCSFVNVLGINS